MHRARKRLGLVVALGLALTPSWASAQAAPHRLAANVLAGLGGLASSAADPNAAMVVGVGLARPDPVGEAALYKQLYQSGNADYRRFLTPAQFAARFGVPADTYAATVSWLRAGGLSVDATSGSRDYVLATGTVAAVQRVFGTTIRRFRMGSTSFLANTLGPSIPGDLPIVSVVGLNTYQRFKTAPQPARPLGLLGILPSIGATTPQSLWSVYDQPDALPRGGPDDRRLRVRR